MGNDGGSIPKRRELVKTGARAATVSELKATALESLTHAWTSDPVTSEPLDTANAVSDWRGRLYNYETVLQGLVNGDGDDGAEAVPRLVGDVLEEVTFASTGIKSLRDVVRVQFKRTEVGDGGTKKTIITCPVSLKELGPAARSVYLVPCGHAFAEIAIKEISEKTCPVCSEPFERRDIIAILPIDKLEIERLTRRIEDLKIAGLAHSLKKEKGSKKKDKKRKTVDRGESGDVATNADAKVEKAKKPAPIDSRLSGINNAFAASLTAKVLADQDEANKRRKLAAAR
jgi:hypothetical protein